MKRISDINVLRVEREFLSETQRDQLRRERVEQEKEKGYQMLTELCELGEYDAAKQLANKNSRWGYEIVDGMVMEKIE
ncbi:MAG TPA: hypothetical protein VK211_15555 [Kamptonema sp.]|nr:hypothetical protein [Kamptonema sp.]